MDPEKRAAVDVWLGWPATFLNVEDSLMFKSEILATGGCFLLIWSRCRSQTGYNDLQYRPGKSPRYIMIANRLEEGNIYVCPDSHYYV